MKQNNQNLIPLLLKRSNLPKKELKQAEVIQKKKQKKIRVTKEFIRSYQERKQLIILMELIVSILVIALLVTIIQGVIK